MTQTVQISANNIYSIFKQHKFGYLGGRDFAISDDGLNWSVINHYTDLLLTNPSTALIGDYYYIISDDSFYKTKDFNTFIKLDTQITDDKHTDLHNFEWFQDGNGSWFIKYNATSTNNAVYTYWADFDETTDSFVDAFQQFDLPNGEASGLIKVRGKYYIWQTGDKLFCADDYTGQFTEIATDIAGDTAHKQFSTVSSNNYLYAYYDADGAIYERSSKITNLIHWTKPVKVVNVGLGSYFYNEKAISVYPSFEKKDSFNKILKLTANGFKQTVPISCMVPTSLQVQWEQNGSYQISFTACDDKSVSYTMLSEEADIEFNGQHYIVKQAVEDAGGGIDTKQITATHIYNEINRVRQRNTKTGTLTYSVQDVLSFYLDDKVANPFGFTYAVYGSFDKQQIENLGNSSGSDMLSKITEQWPQAIIYPDNKNIRVYSPESFAKDYGGRIDYLHNSSDVKMTVDSTTITNQVKVFGKQIENTDDNATENAPVKYYFDPFIVEDKDSIKQYGLHPMDDVSDERFTDKNAMQTYAKGQLSPNPAVGIEVTMEDNEVPYAGEKRHLIAKPLNLETDLTVIGYTWYPFDNAQKNSLSFANLPASILKTQANINNRIRMVQLIAQQAINSAKTGTRNYISQNDPMKNENNDVRSGDIWTLPLLTTGTQGLLKSANVQGDSTTETNQTIYTDPSKMDKVPVQLSIWSGSRWLEIGNQRTINTINENQHKIADQVAEQQKDIATAVKNAQAAVDNADKAIQDAGFATEAAKTAKEVADSVKDDVTTAKTDSATALTNAKDALDKAGTASTAAASASSKVDEVEGKLIDKADKTDIDTINKTVKGQDTLIEQNAEAIKKTAKQSDVNTLTGRVKNVESSQDQMADEIKTKVTSSDVQGLLDKDGYATQKWTGSQIDQKANEISKTVVSVSNKVDNLPIGSRNLVPNSGDPQDTSNWQSYIKSGSGGTFGTLTHNFFYDGSRNMFILTTKSTEENYFWSSSIKVKSNADYTLTFDAFADGNVRDCDVWFNATDGTDAVNKLLISKTSAWSNSKDQRVSVTFNTGNMTSGVVRFDNNGSKTEGTICGLYVGDITLVEGRNPAPWTSALEDLATVTALSKTDQKADELTDTVTNNKTDADAKFTQQKQTIEGIQKTVADKADSSVTTQLKGLIQGKVDTKDFQSKYTQLANDINIRVKQGDLITQINAEAGQLLFQSKKIYLDADTVVFGKNSKAFIPSAAIASLSADKIDVSKATISNGDNAIDMSGDGIKLKGADTSLTLKNDSLFLGKNNDDARYKWGVGMSQNGFEFGVPVKFNGKYSYEIQGYVAGNGWDYDTATMSGNGNSGIVIGVMPHVIWGDPYGGDDISIGQYIRNGTPNGKAFDAAFMYTSTGTGVAGGHAGLYAFKDLRIMAGAKLMGDYDNDNRLDIDANVYMTNKLTVNGDIGATKGKSYFKQIDTSGGIVGYDIRATHWLGTSGTKAAVVLTSQGTTELNAYETAEYYFGDIQEATTDDNSKIVIPIEKIFGETVRTDLPYHVFVSSYSDAYLWVTDRTATSFTVHSSKPNASFSYEIKAKRRGYENKRLENTKHMDVSDWDNKAEAQEAGASEQILKTYKTDGDVVNG